jgi:hypothetical protein
MNDLVDIMPFEYQITESENGRFRVEGVFQRSDVENANKRVYPRSIWEKELKEQRVQDMLSHRAMFGELDHPSDGKTSLKRVSHIITDLQLEQDGVVSGAAEILPTPNGQILRSLFESGAQVGISSRGSGSVSNGVVQEDFKLGTFDFVARPSTPGALPRLATGESNSRTRTEGDEAVDTLVVVDDKGNDTGDLQGVDMDLFNKFCDTLEGMSVSSLDEEFSTGDLNAVAHDVIELHNVILKTKERTPEFIDEATGAVIQLTGMLSQLIAEEPQNRAVIAELMEKLEDSRRALIFKSLTEEFDKEEKPMDRLQFIKDRLQEAAYYEAQEVSPEAEVEELRQELEEMDDDQLIAVAIEAGVIDPDDLEEDDDEIDGDVTVQDLLDYAAELESNLDEAAEVVEQLVAALEESDDVDDIKLKYEAALGIIQETVARYQMLQEAVGGEEKANEIMENHLNALERNAGIAEGREGSHSLTEGYDGAAAVETILNKDIADDPQMARNLSLVEGALELLGPTAN